MSSEDEDEEELEDEVDEPDEEEEEDEEDEELGAVASPAWFGFFTFGGRLHLLTTCRVTERTGR
eukprot:gene7829-9299_t